MSGAQLVVAALEAAHDRSRFACGTPALDRYLREVVTQDVRRRVAACFVMLDGNVVAGYYTLSAASVALTDLPHAIARKLPRYPANQSADNALPDQSSKRVGTAWCCAIASQSAFVSSTVDST